MRLKLLMGAAVGCLLCAVATPSMSRPMPRPTQAASPQPLAANPYENPDGTYRSYTAFDRELEGVPCGIECWRRAERAWSHFPRSPVPHSPIY